MNSDPTERFSSRVENYVRYRPGYPEGLWDDLADRLPAAAAVADVGSGTGIFSAGLLQRGLTVWGVEPNDAMRQRAESDLGENRLFHSVKGRAEATGLPDSSVDAITAAQAFHWFAHSDAAGEFRRILKPGGLIALIWNERVTGGDAFSEGYESLLCRYAIDYREVRHENITPELIASLFPEFEWESSTYANHQDFSWDGLYGRLESSSYVPRPDHPNHAPLVSELQRLFADTQRDGRVRMNYETKAYWLRAKSD